MHIYAISIFLFCFIAAIMCVIQMYVHLKDKERKVFNTFFPYVFAEYLATTLEEKGRPGIWFFAFILFAFLAIFLMFAQLFWSIKAV